jgi:ATP-binding cassette subfamily B protein
MVGAKLANVGVPVLLKHLVDRMDIKPGDPRRCWWCRWACCWPMALRLSTSLFTELRELVFAKATQGAARRSRCRPSAPARLSLRFHLERQTGGMTRDIERGVRAIESLISYSLYSILPTLVEVALVLAMLGTKFDAGLPDHAGGAGVLHRLHRVVTEWRTSSAQGQRLGRAHQGHRLAAELRDGQVLQQRGFEARRYDESLERLRRARLKSQTTLSLLNTGQQLIIATGWWPCWRATQGVVDGRMTLGDLVMVNAFMIQLYIPLNFLGVIYREIKQSLTDLDKMFTLMDKEREVADARRARLQVAGAHVRFEDVHFAYDPAAPSCTA